MPPKTYGDEILGKATDDFLNSLKGSPPPAPPPLPEKARQVVGKVREVLAPSRVLDYALDRMIQKAPGLASDSSKEELRTFLANYLTEHPEHQIALDPDESRYALDIQTPRDVYWELLEGLAAIEGFKPSWLGTIRVYTKYIDIPNATAEWYPRANDPRAYDLAINQGLWWFISAFSKVLALWFAPHGEEIPMVDGHTRIELLRGILSLLEDNPQALKEIAPLRVRRPEQDIVSQRFARHAKQFVIGHEVAHAWLRHPETSVPRVEMGRRELWAQEHAADKRAVTILMGANMASDDVNDFEWAYLGADLFLSLVGLLELAFPTGGQSHPPAQLRQQRLREHLRETIGEGAASAMVQKAAACDSLMAEIGRQAT